MKRSSLLVLRLGLGVTFVWIGALILMNPRGWGLMIQPWALSLLPAPLILMMQVTAVMDIAVGVMLIFGLWTWIAAALGFFHLLTVIITVGVNGSTVRDIGLAAASLALAVETLPGWVMAKLMAMKKPAAKPANPQ